MDVNVNLVGGGFARLSLEASDLQDVAELMRRERGLIGRLLELGEESGHGPNVLVPAHRVAMISEV